MNPSNPCDDDFSTILHPPTIHSGLLCMFLTVIHWLILYIIHILLYIVYNNYTCVYIIYIYIVVEGEPQWGNEGGYLCETVRIVSEISVIVWAGAEIWGCGAQLGAVQKVQMRAARIFLGVGRRNPSA